MLLFWSYPIDRPNPLKPINLVGVNLSLCSINRRITGESETIMRNIFIITLLIRQVLVSEPFSVPWSSATPETPLWNSSFSHTPSWDSLCLRPWDFSVSWWPSFSFLHSKMLRRSCGVFGDSLLLAYTPPLAEICFHSSVVWGAAPVERILLEKKTLLLPTSVHLSLKYRFKSGI